MELGLWGEFTRHLQVGLDTIPAVELSHLAFLFRGIRLRVEPVCLFYACMADAIRSAASPFLP